jgi:hypothetical protein
MTVLPECPAPSIIFRLTSTGQVAECKEQGKTKGKKRGTNTDVMS